MSILCKDLKCVVRHRCRRPRRPRRPRRCPRPCRCCRRRRRRRRRLYQMSSHVVVTTSYQLS